VLVRCCLWSCCAGSVWERVATGKPKLASGSFGLVCVCLPVVVFTGSNIQLPVSPNILGGWRVGVVLACTHDVGTTLLYQS
jgi:hypothetical protein